MTARLISNNPLSPLERMFRAMELFRSVYPAPSGQLIEAFLVVASNPDGTVTQGDVARALGCAAGQASGLLGKLSGNARFGENLALVDIQVDPTDARQRLHRLTRRGRELATTMAQTLRGRE